MGGQPESQGDDALDWSTTAHLPSVLHVVSIAAYSSFLLSTASIITIGIYAIVVVVVVVLVDANALVTHAKVLSRKHFYVSI